MDRQVNPRSLYFAVIKKDENVAFSLMLMSSAGEASELFSAVLKAGEGKDRAFNDLLYELMRLDALYDIPVSTQVDILYHMVIEENVEVEI